MTGQPLRQTVLVTNPQGFHLRPVAAFARQALRFQCAVHVIKGDQRVDGKSALELLTLAAEPGTQLTIETCGPDAGAALAILAELVNTPAEEPAGN